MNADQKPEDRLDEESIEKEPYVAPEVESIGLSDDAADSLT